MCQCPPKCVKCCKAATIYRSTLHVLHERPQPQHSWPWEHRTPCVVTNDAVPNFTPLSFSTTPFLNEALVPRNVSAQLKDRRNGSNLVKNKTSVCKMDNRIEDSFKPSVCKMDLPNFTPLSFSTTPFLNEALVPRIVKNTEPAQDSFKPSVCKLDFNPNVSMFQTDQDPYYATQSGDNYKGIIVAKPKQNPLMIKKIPLMSLTLTREKKRRARNKTRKVKRKIAEDLRLLLDEKKKQK
jgi:hypothetical protein